MTWLGIILVKRYLPPEARCVGCRPGGHFVLAIGESQACLGGCLFMVVVRSCARQVTRPSLLRPWFVRPA